MITREITVGAKAITPKETDIGTKGSYGIYQLAFTFSDEWEGLAKKISFFPANRGTPVAVTLATDDTLVPVPIEATANAGKCTIIVSGTASGVLLISLEATLTVDDTKSPVVTPVGSPTPTEIEQLYALIGKLPLVDESGYWKLWNYETGVYEITEYPTTGFVTNLTLTEITLGNYKIKHNTEADTLNIEYIE